MGTTAEQATQADSNLTRAAVVADWSELNACLERRSRELSEEVRSYPTPIARCDEQLTKLIEQRTRAFDRLRELNALGPAPSGRAGGRWYAALDEFLRSAQAATDDAGELAIQSRLRAAVRALRRVK